MFKKLKNKLEQGVGQSPLKGALASASRVGHTRSCYAVNRGWGKVKNVKLSVNM